MEKSEREGEERRDGEKRGEQKTEGVKGNDKREKAKQQVKNEDKAIMQPFSPRRQRCFTSHQDTHWCS